MPSIVLAASLLVASAMVAIRPVSGHCKIIRAAAHLSPDGVFDQVYSSGFGVAIDNEFPWYKSEGGDAGGDAPFFSKKIEWVENPDPACGQNEQWGDINIPAWLGLSEARGVATIPANGKFEAEIFQVNRDGAGECTCEYDTDAKATNFKKCSTVTNPPGIDGMWPVDRVNHTAVFQLPPDTVCTGGVFEDKCIIRIRCGWKLRFGGCLALKTESSPAPKALEIISFDGKAPVTVSEDGPLDDAAITTLAQQVFDAMMEKGKIVNVKGKRSCEEKRSIESDDQQDQRMHTKRSEAKTIEQAKMTIAEKVLEMLKSQDMRVVA